MRRGPQPQRWLELLARVSAYHVVGWPEACIEWPFSKHKAGYGVVLFGTRQVLVHRLAWHFTYGAWPKQTLDHVKARGCLGGACYNVAHLEDVSAAENTRRAHLGTHGVNAGARKTHCLHGHEFSKTNTRITPQGKRVCRCCARDRERARRQSAHN